GRHAEDVGLVAAERLADLPGPGVEDFHGLVTASGGDPSVAEEHHAVDLEHILVDDRCDPAGPLEVVPFPVAKVVRTITEQLQGRVQGARGTPRWGRGQWGEGGGPPPRAGGCPPVYPCPGSGRGGRFAPRPSPPPIPPRLLPPPGQLRMPLPAPP